MAGIDVPDFTAMMTVVESARVVDFMRYVSHQLESSPHLAELSFRDGWNVMIGGYASTYAERPA